MNKNFKDALKEKMEMNAEELNKANSNETVADLIIKKVLKRVVEKPTTTDLVNLAKVNGELNEATNINIVPLEEALKGCKQSEE